MPRVPGSTPFLKMISVADVVLHPFPFGGSKTSADALVCVGIPRKLDASPAFCCHSSMLRWVPFPGLTSPARGAERKILARYASSTDSWVFQLCFDVPSAHSFSLVGHMAPAFFRTMDLEHLVMKTEDDYVNFAVQLADRAQREAFSSLLRQRVPRIWRNMTYVLDWGRFFERAIASVEWQPDDQTRAWLLQQDHLAAAAVNSGLTNAHLVPQSEQPSLSYQPAIAAQVSTQSVLMRPFLSVVFCHIIQCCMLWAWGLITLLC